VSVLILRHESDAVADRVAAELAVRGVPVVRLNPSAFPKQLSMSARIVDSRSWHGWLKTDDGKTIDLAEIRTVWQRGSSQFVMDERMSGPELAFAYGEARRGFGGVLASLGHCLWVNDPMAAARAEYKPVQLAAATDVGLHVPETLITSDPESAYEWATKLRRPIIYKPLSGVWHADEGQLRVLYTTPVEDPHDLLDQRLGLTAHLFQERVEKVCEARAVVIKDKVMTVRIDAGSSAAREDWRSDYDSLTYTPIELPASVSSALVQLHERLGLVYGAVDLACDVRDRWVFLETNQRGEFGWLGEETGLPIAATVADLLEKGI
jgi:ATP-grasp ribosomal peptide maturase